MTPQRLTQGAEANMPSHVSRPLLIRIAVGMFVAFVAVLWGSCAALLMGAERGRPLFSESASIISTMPGDEAAPEIHLPSLIQILRESSPIAKFGWFSLFIIIIMGGILLVVPPQSGRRISLVDIFAACLHIQLLVFILCVPLPLIGASYLTTSNFPHVMDAFVGPASVILNFTTSGALLVSVAFRQRTRPTIEWLPIVSVLTTIISLFAAWALWLAVQIPIQ